MIGLGLLRGVFLGGVMMWYTMSVWKTVDQYFRDQFQEYLIKEYEENSAMRKDVLLDKEKLAARKILLEKLDKLESSVDGRVEPELGGKGINGDLAYSLGYKTQSFIDENFVSYPSGYSLEEFDGKTSGLSMEISSDYEVDGRIPALEEDGGGGECFFEDCGEHGSQVTTRWRNVFDEEDDVCHLDDQLSDKPSCSNPLEYGEGDEADGGSK